MALLFPKKPRSNLLIKKLKLGPLIYGIQPLPREKRKFAHYTYWSNRLFELEETFREEKADVSLNQMWKDRSDATAWWSSWMGIAGIYLAISYGTIQCVEGALQVYKAYHPSPA
jgi:hypothetical protein